jgi:hypothetical protein
MKLRNLGLSQFIWCSLAARPLLFLVRSPHSRIVFILSRGCLEEEIKIKKEGNFCKRGKERVGEGPGLPCAIFFLLQLSLISGSPYLQ